MISSVDTTAGTRRCLRFLLGDSFHVSVCHCVFSCLIINQKKNFNRSFFLFCLLSGRGVEKEETCVQLTFHMVLRDQSATATSLSRGNQMIPRRVINVPEL
ncbi:unnamed protein product [Ixodes pacificus]